MNLTKMFFQSGEGIARTIIVGILAYIIVIVFLRVSGKRTLAKLNAFDLVVTVALGSTLSAILLQKSIPLAEGATALGLLIAMQFLVTFFSVRSKRFAGFIRSEATLLIRYGQICHTIMKRERIMPDEVLSAIRSAGGSDIQDAEFVILESDGTLSVELMSDETKKNAKTTM